MSFAVFGGAHEKNGMKKRGDFRTILEPLRLLFSSVWPSSRNHSFCRLKTKTCFFWALGAVYFFWPFWHSAAWPATQNSEMPCFLGYKLDPSESATRSFFRSGRSQSCWPFWCFCSSFVVFVVVVVFVLILGLLCCFCCCCCCCCCSYPGFLACCFCCCCYFSCLSSCYFC